MDQILDVMEGWVDQYGAENGTFVVDFACSPNVVVSSQERAEEILRHRPKITQRSHQVNEAVNSLGGTGLFSAECEQWKRERKLVAAALNQKSVQDYLSALRRMSRRLVDKWLGERGETRIDDDLKAISSESVAKVSLNRDYDFLHQVNHPIQKDIDTIMAAFTHRAFTGFRYWRIPIVGQYLDGKGWSIRRFGEVMNGVVKEYEAVYKTASADQSAGMSASARRTFWTNCLRSWDQKRRDFPVSAWWETSWRCSWQEPIPHPRRC
jgi:cytochrome P450